MTVILIKALQLLIALAVLILVHESGHFMFSKMFGIRVDKFFLFFDAGGVKLFSTRQKWFLKLFPGAAKWETEYGIGWLPFGGYCKIAGMVDESMDTESLKNEPQPWEFRTHPAWQRIIVMGGGVLFNFILAIAVYTGILAHWGESYVRNEGTSIYVNGLAYEMGFRSGDQILRFDDYVPENFYMLQADLARRDVSKATVLRDGDTLDIYIDHNMIGEMLDSPDMFDIAVPFVISGIPESSINYGSGMQAGDKVIALAGEKVEYLQDARQILTEHKGTEIPVEMLRGNDTVVLDMKVDTSGMLGVGIMPLDPSLIVQKKYSIPEAIPAGFRKMSGMVGGYLQDLRLVATPSTEAYKQVGSFISIGRMFPAVWDWHYFLNMLAYLSLMLGVMNLLPIPALDGGHIMFTIYEMITGRKPSEKFLMAAQMIGMLLVFGLLTLACGNDFASIGELLRK